MKEYYMPAGYGAIANIDVDTNKIVEVKVIYNG